MDAIVRPAPRFDPGDIRGLKFFRPIRRLLDRLRPDAADPNRKLHFDHYTCLLLLYFFTPTLQSLRDIQKASDFKTVARKLGVRRASLGSLSEASHVFDPELLKAICYELADQAHAGNAVPRPTGIPDDLAYIAADGSLLDALPKMLWAHWIGEHDKAVKVHLQFDIFRGVPVKSHLTDGNGSEITALKQMLQPSCLYIVDRGYMDYSLYQTILDNKSSFLARLRGNFVHETVETRELTHEARAAGVQSDEIVWMGCEKTKSRMKANTTTTLIPIYIAAISRQISRDFASVRAFFCNGCVRPSRCDTASKRGVPLFASSIVAGSSLGCAALSGMHSLPCVLGIPSTREFFFNP
jgi:hypothetical protein